MPFKNRFLSSNIWRDFSLQTTREKVMRHLVNVVIRVVINNNGGDLVFQDSFVDFDLGICGGIFETQRKLSGSNHFVTSAILAANGMSVK